MSKWGAKPESWEELSTAGIANDLLPVVSNPGAEVSERSKLSASNRGKVPSLYNGDGFVSGIAGWTQKETTDVEIKHWKSESDYGICIQTRNVRAFDIDVEDRKAAQMIRFFIEKYLGFELPCRGRADSGKILLAYRLSGGYTKQVLPVSGGMIENLNNGQQFIAHGTHPKGAKYEWEWTGGELFPEISKTSWDSLCFALQEEFGTDTWSVNRQRKRGEVVEFTGEDLVYKYLEDQELVLDVGNDGQAFIECPWKDEHTSDSGVTETAYFAPGTGGYECGHFKCLHAHCEERTDSEFEIALGCRATEFENIQNLVKEDNKDIFPDWRRNRYGEPKALLNNLINGLESPRTCKVTPVYDGFKDEFIYRHVKSKKWKPVTDGFYYRLQSLFEGTHNFLPISTDLMRRAVHVVAERNTVDTAEEWLLSQEWDGEDRITNFLPEYWGVKTSPYSIAVSKYIWTALAGRVLVPGLKVDMVPILQGPQGIAKSTAIESLSPTPNQFVEISFHESDDTLARKMRGKLVAEIPELKGLRSREVEHIKAFITRTHEQWIPKYREFAVTYPRRMVAFGTTNDEQFLMDTTGNRRWLPFKIDGVINLEKQKADLKQLWSQARVMFEEKGLMYAEAEALAGAEHEQFMIRDGWVDVIAKWLDIETMEGAKNGDSDFNTIDVLREALDIDVRRVQRADEMKVSSALRHLGYESTAKRIGNRVLRTWERKTP